MKRVLYIVFFVCSFAQSQMIVDSYKFAAGYDSDAQAYFDVATGLSTAEKDAWNDFVVSAKDNGYYSKFVAFYPLRGGDTSNMKWNAIDPRDLDAAFRITWVGTATYNSTGYLADNNTDWGDTHWIAGTHGTSTDFGWGMYLSGNFTGGYYAGVSESNSEAISLSPKTGTNGTSVIGYNNGAGSVTGAITTSTGFFMMVEETGTSHKFYWNGSVVGSTETNDDQTRFNAITNPLVIGGRTFNGAASLTLLSTTQAYWISSSFTSTNISDFNTDLEAFMDALSIGQQ